MSALKVLVVDDQPAVCAALELLFDVHGLETLTARTPERALELVRSEDLGVVLQDMNYHRDATSGEEGEALLRANQAARPRFTRAADDRVPIFGDRRAPGPRGRQ